MKFTTTQIMLLCITVVLCVGLMGYFSNVSTQIEAEKAVQTKQIEQVEEEVREKQATERTEERSQFWQKLVPWGSDEEEVGE